MERVDINVVLKQTRWSLTWWQLALVGMIAFFSGMMTWVGLNYLIPPNEPSYFNSLAPQTGSVKITPASYQLPSHTELHRPAIFTPASISLRVNEGDTLISVLTDTGITYDEAAAAVAAMRPMFDPRRLDAGAQVAVKLDADKKNPALPTITALSMPVSKTTTVELKRTASGTFNARKIEAPTETHQVLLGGRITSSFYETARTAGIPAEAIDLMIKNYSYDVDFQRDIQRGDRIEAMVERTQTKDGIVTGFGNLTYAALTFKHHTLAIYRYADRSGNVDYYTEKGESLRKALLRTPINGARITSGFGMRVHPLLGYSRMHRGVDFGAAEGTPIYAAGDGVVEIAGPHAGYGNYVRLRHNDHYETAYGHASRIASGVRPGAHVKQGQVIAYVGMTGLATGPHLHYEVLISGDQVNPAGVKFKTGNMLAGKELNNFRGKMKSVQLAVAEQAPKQVASAK